MKGTRLTWPIRLLLAALLVTLSGCSNPGKTIVSQKLKEAGDPEPGTQASWVRGQDQNGAQTPGEREIVLDPDGRWAISATASSTFGDVAPHPGFTPAVVCGPVDVPAISFDRRAWAPLRENYGYEWLELLYETPVYATGVRIRETWAPGAVVMVHLKDTNGGYHLKWKDKERTPPYINWLVLDFPTTDYLVNGVRVTLDTTLCAHFNQFDTVQLVGQPE